MIVDLGDGHGKGLRFDHHQLWKLGIGILMRCLAGRRN